jgi:hypothetical protein
MEKELLEHMTDVQKKETEEGSEFKLIVNIGKNNIR